MNKTVIGLWKLSITGKLDQGIIPVHQSRFQRFFNEIISDYFIPCFVMFVCLFVYLFEPNNFQLPAFLLVMETGKKYYYIKSGKYYGNCMKILFLFSFCFSKV